MTTEHSSPRPIVQVSDHEQEKHLLDYLRVVYKRRWIAIPAFLIVFVTSAVNTFRATPIYQATTQILIEKDAPTVANLDELFRQQEGWFQDEFYQTQYRILRSRSLAARAVDKLKLGDRPLYRPDAGGDAQPSAFSLSYVIASVSEAIRPFLPASWTAKAGEAEADEPVQPAETTRQSALVSAFLGGLEIVPVRNSRLVDVKFASPDPELAAKAANALAQGYIEQNLESKFATSKQAASWLANQLADQRKRVEESEAALQRYKEQNDVVPAEDTQNIVVQKLAELNAAFTRAKTERLEKEATYKQLEGMDATAIDAFPAVLANQFIQRIKAEIADLERHKGQLAQTYGERHPEMIKVNSALATAQAKLRVELDRVVQGVRNEYLAALAHERGLANALSAQKNEALSLNRRGLEYSVLLREAESNRQIYESLLQRTGETGISSELRVSNTRVVDPAEIPRSPAFPNKRRDLLLAALGGLLLAFGLAFGFEYLDNRIKTPQELRAYLGIPLLGMVPALPKSVEGPLVNNGVPPNFTEAIRAVRTNVLFSSVEEGSRSIVVTSAGPGEGKSLVSSNLAVSLAQAEQRVLLIDADMRRPRVHELLGLSEEPGLSNLLVGQCKTAEALRKTSVPGLWVISSGKIPPNPAELLGSRRFGELLKALDEHFDYVVIDSPPVLAVADASIVANPASGVLFVVGSDQTTRQSAKAALEQLQAVRAHVVGAVLNRVGFDRHPYYYSHYYRKDYARYYVRPGSPRA